MPKQHPRTQFCNGALAANKWCSITENMGFGHKVVDWMLLALLKYPFYYMIRSYFGKFFGVIHVLTSHLAPELDRFLLS